MAGKQQFYHVMLTNDVLKKCHRLKVGHTLSVLTTHTYKNTDLQVMVQFWTIEKGFVQMLISEVNANGATHINVSDLGNNDTHANEMIDLSTVLPSHTNLDIDEINKVTKGQQKHRKDNPVCDDSDISDGENSLVINEALPNNVKLDIVNICNNIVNLDNLSGKEKEEELELVSSEKHTDDDNFVRDREINMPDNSSNLVESEKAVNSDDSDATDIYNEKESGTRKKRIGTEVVAKSEQVTVKRKRGRPRKTDTCENTSRKLAKRPAKAVVGKEKCKTQPKIIKKRSKKIARIANPNHRFKCELCSFTARARQYLFRHVRSQHPNSSCLAKGAYKNLEPVTCSFCNKTLPHGYSLHRHVKNQHSENPGYEAEVARLQEFCQFKCSYCPKILKRPTDLQRHISNLHEYDIINGIKCEQCNLVLKNDNCFQNHIKNTHKTEKNWLCTICGNRYKHKGNLTEHWNNVHSTESFPCDIEGCQFVARSTKYLKRHQKSKHGLATFMCDICARKFKNIHKLNLHKKLIHEVGQIEKHTCPECGKKFNLKSNMKKHIDGVHNKTWKFNCVLCRKGFFSSKLLEVHHLKMHTHNIDIKKTVSTTISSPTSSSNNRASLQTIEPLQHPPPVDYSSSSPHRGVPYQQSMQEYVECRKKTVSTYRIIEHNTTEIEQDKPLNVAVTSIDAVPDKEIEPKTTSHTLTPLTVVTSLETISSPTSSSNSRASVQTIEPLQYPPPVDYSSTSPYRGVPYQQGMQEYYQEY